MKGRRSWKGWSLSSKLAAAALALGALSMAGDPYGGGRVSLDQRELARVVESEVDHVTPRELAAWMVAGRTDYRVLDLRDEADYATYHLPGAERVAITELADYPLYRNETIVLYSGGGIHSAQAWFLLRSHGYAGAVILLGGLDAWTDEVLFPALADGAPDGAERAELARHFGGQPRGAAAAAGAASPELPEIEMPAAPAAPPPARRGKKKEGC